MSITEETRRESYEKLDNESLQKHILSILENGKGMTARECAVAMYSKGYVAYPMRQSVAPRLTELVEEGLVEVCGKAYDDETNRNVAVYRLVEE